MPAKFKAYKRLFKQKGIISLSLLDEYILKQVGEVFVLGVIIFSSIIFASETFTQLIKQITLYGIPMNIAAMMVILNLPQVFVVTIPISTLFATVMTINKLSLNSEITVLRACGIGISRIAKPVFAFAIVMTFLCFLINEFVVPAMSTQSRHLAIYSLQQKHVPEGRRNFTLNETNSNGQLKRLFYVQSCEDKILNNITVVDLSKDDTVQLIQAKIGKTSGEGWIFDGGVIYTLSAAGKIFNTTLFENSVVNFGIENIGNVVEQEANQFNFFRLMKFIKENMKNSKFIEQVRIQYQIQLHDKLALPVTTFSLALIGIPLAITPPRVRYNRGFLFSVMIIFIYYVVRAFSLNLGEASKLPPFLAAWLPVITITLIGLILYCKKAYRI
ncbi:MAG: LptF/LptG family permease [Candidatus Gastranaerophilales bacterium]|nr:LptF/LptG family permease [Candidatus Gastranaerophilales bacterium]